VVFIYIGGWSKYVAYPSDDQQHSLGKHDKHIDLIKGAKAKRERINNIDYSNMVVTKYQTIRCVLKWPNEYNFLPNHNT